MAKSAIQPRSSNRMTMESTPPPSGNINAPSFSSQSLEEDIESAAGETQALVVAATPSTSSPGPSTAHTSSGGSGITRTGLQVLVLLAVQNSSKNLLMRWVMKDQPKFLSSAAVIGSECTKFTLSLLYILLVQGQPVSSVLDFFKEEWKNTLLVAVPASAYNLQMSLEYVALANLDAANFSVLVQSKLVFTAVFAAIVLRKRLKYVQVLSLALLTVGVMLCNMKFTTTSTSNHANANPTKGILATLGIAVSSGFASVYTEKVIKRFKAATTAPKAKEYSLAYTQVQLASMSLVTIGIYALLMDWAAIAEHGLFYNFDVGAKLTVLNSALGGLIVAGVLKYADSVLKGYATACSVVLTGTLSMVLFGTQLHTVYFLGMVNVLVSILLYNGKDFERLVC